MNRFVLHIILLFFSHLLNAQGQNLVYNGSFEEYSECPVSNELNNGQFERATGWWRPTDCTPDYFNSCNNDIVGVPDNFWGHQEAFCGDGYVGFIPVMDNGTSLGSEYFRTKLISPLKPCVEYRFSMYVSLADFSTHGVGNLGAFFSAENEFQNGCEILKKNPQIKYTEIPITDTITWTKIEGTFVANGFEKYLTIGHFQNAHDIDTIFVQKLPFGSFDFHPYYYVDSVSLYEIGAVSSDLCNYHIDFPNVFTPNNDGSNDILDVTKYIGFIEEIYILNRWGNVVTVLSKENSIWNGENSSDGVYYYFFEYDLGNIKTQQSGFIQLVR